MKQKNFFMMLVLAFGATTFMTAQVPSYVPTNGLVGYWPFNGNANDMSTNANNGTNNGATLTADRFGNANSAYSFDGTSNYLNLNKTISNQFTISLWVSVSSFKTYIVPGPNTIGSHIIGTLNNNFGSSGFACSLSGVQSDYGIHGFGFWTQTGNPGISSNNLFILNNWKHLICTYDGTTLKYYDNGQFVGSANGSYVQNQSNLTVGARLFHLNGPDFFLNGKVDDVGLWNRALTEQEISNLYNANICYQSVTVTDTLIINTGILGYNPITYDNAITMYPNPAKDHLTIDCGTLAKVTGYQIKVTNSLGQEVFKTTLNQQQITTPLNAWGGTGMYFVNVYNAQGQQIEVRKIILQ